MRPFRLPGGDRAGREPWRSAAALCWECGVQWTACPDPDGLAKAAWQRHLNAPRTSAVGRLFDAASAIVCDLRVVTFEAQGPMQLEALCPGAGDIVALPMIEGADGVLRTDWQPLLAMLLDARRSRRERAASFHASMAEAAVQQVRHIGRSQPIDRIGLTGGVFQNRALTEQVVSRLAKEGHRVRLGALLPCNDAALSFGQLADLAASEAAPAP
jgi:hydrogenase maturation protein HypF